MTEYEFKRTMEALRKTRETATSSKEAARAYLIKAGFVDEDGRLSEQYRDQ